MKKSLLLIFAVILASAVMAQTFTAGNAKEIKLNRVIDNSKTLDTIWTYVDRATNYYIYGVTGGGYIFGNNGYYSEVAMNYDGIANASVTEVIAWIGSIDIVNTADNFTAKIYTATNDTTPGTMIGSATYSMGNVDTTSAGLGGWTFIPLSTAANTNGQDFFVSIDATMTDDTLGIVCSNPSSNDGAGEKRAVLNYGGTWYSIDDMFGGFDADGMILPIVDIVTGADFMESNGLTVNRVYPNPAKENCTLTYSIEEAQSVSLKVFGLNGQTIFESNGFQAAGEHSVNIDLSDVAAGNYYFSIKTDNANINSRIVVVK